MLAGKPVNRKTQQTQKVPSETEEEQEVCKNYALWGDRLHQIITSGTQWVVPYEMRQQVLRVAHHEIGHFVAEKNLKNICTHYRSPSMRKYVGSCIPYWIHCLPGGISTWRKAFFTQYIVAIVVGFTFIGVVKTTKIKCVIEFFKEPFAVCGIPRLIISDQGNAFTSKHFKATRDERLSKSKLNALITTTLGEGLRHRKIGQIQ